MASVNIDQLSSLAISETEINNNIKNITNLSSVINTCTKNYTDFTTNITDLSNNFVDLYTNINDFSSNLTDLSTTNNVFINMGNSIDQMNEKLNTSDKSAKKASSGFSKLGKFAKTAFSSISFDSFKSGMDTVDKYINSSNSLARINDNPEKLPELQDKVNAAANRSSTSYTDMVSSVSDIGSLDTFKSNDETIAFAELMQKSLKANGSDQSLSNVTESMSDGVIQGDEFSSLVSGAPSIGEAMSASTGKSIEQLQAMADQGMITADVLKNSMFASSDEINSDFSEQPKTFADIWTQISNSAMNALNPLMQLVSNIINSDGFQGFINVIISGLSFVSSLISSLMNFISSNSSLIQALLIAIGAVLLGVLATSIVAWFTMYGPILLIIGAITAIIYIITQLGVSFQDIFSFVGGIIGAFYAFFYNAFVGMWNQAAAFINFFGNAFNDPITSIKILFCDLVANVLGYIGSIAQGIQDLLNKIPGVEVDLTSNISELKTAFENEADETKKASGYKTFVGTMDNISYSDAVNKGSNKATKIYDTVEGALKSAAAGDEGYDYSQYGTSNDILGTTSNPTTIQGTGSNGSVVADMQDEDLGYLQDMAERDYIANVATNTLAPNISVSFGDVHETADVNQLFGRIQTILKEQIAVAPEGVY